jgi:endoglucanase
MIARVLLLVLILGFSFSVARVSQGQSSLDLRRGVNLTGWFQFGEFQESRFAELSQLRLAGADFIRLPIQPPLLYDPKSKSWLLLERVLLEARRVGLKIIVDFHPAINTQREILGGDPRFLELLSNTAKFLLAFSDVALLEPQNEPISPIGDRCDPAFDWDGIQLRFYQAIRAVNKEVPIILTGACWGGIDGLLKIKPIRDARIMYSAHFYDPMEFTHQGAGWIDGDLRFLRGVPFPPSPARVAAMIPNAVFAMPTAAGQVRVKNSLLEYGKSGWEFGKIANRLALAQAWASKNNAKLLLGEFGVLQTDAPPEDRVAYITAVTGAAERLGVAFAAWDFNPVSGFSLHRNGLPEAKMFMALGLKAPSNAVATPKNPLPIERLVNPVARETLVVADFTKGSQNLLGVATGYYGYGQPAMPTFTPALANGVAPIQNGRLEFEFSYPLSNDYGGVAAVVPIGKPGALFDSRAFSHLRFELAIVGTGKVRVGLASRKVNTAGDHPQFTVEATDKTEVFTLPLALFRQEGWGTAVQVQEVMRQLETIEITAVSGTKGRLQLDNLAFVNMVEAR